MQYSISKGLPYPFGVSKPEKGAFNFALVSTHATAVALCLFKRDTQELITEIPLPPKMHKTGNVWHVSIAELDSDVFYAFRVYSPFENGKHFLLDPYAKSTSTSHAWGKGCSLPKCPQNSYIPLGEIIADEPFDWESDSPPSIPPKDLLIYEMHVRAFTQDPSSKTVHPGTFLGVIEKIPHLVDLGINAVELMPIHEFNELEYRISHPKTKKPLYNFWGYSTTNFFTPMNRYATSNHKGAAITEFKTMVKALHKNGIEVILDVVFNHTGEGNEKGSVFSFKGIDNSVYYILDTEGKYLNFTGCGNTFNANHPIAQELIINCLRYWVTEMHVDGIRFDLASCLTRGTEGEPMQDAPLIKAITDDPLLSNVKLISEPWDAAGLYQVGHFAPETSRWSEWNAKYRDSARKFIRGTQWTQGEFAMRICGSEDLYHRRGPCSSINFITAHDGFTLADLVSYNMKHNIDNGESNRDGADDNESWNCGVEGPTTNQKILILRERQMRNFHLALMLSQGVPMLLMGDEYGHTKLGNNNTWCQDNLLNWFQWGKLATSASFFRFYRGMIQFRKHHPILRRSSFLTHRDIDWHGTEPFKPDWNGNVPFIAYTLKDHANNNDLFVAFNAHSQAISVKLPPHPYLKAWHWVANTANPSPTDLYVEHTGPIQSDASFKMLSHSAMILEAL